MALKHSDDGYLNVEKPVTGCHRNTQILRDELQKNQNLGTILLLDGLMQQNETSPRCLVGKGPAWRNTQTSKSFHNQDGSVVIPMRVVGIMLFI
jgi:hypothetical protein